VTLPDVRKCLRCGAYYQRTPYGWRYKRYCSYDCKTRSRASASDDIDVRAADHLDCAGYRNCFNEAASLGLERVCAVGCTKYSKSTKPAPRAAANLMSHAWMWEEM
jgi:hypothetical protein